MSVPGVVAPGVYALGQFEDESTQATGVFLTSTASLIAGEAIGGAAASGVILQAVCSIDPGQAIGTASGEALGSIIIVQSSLTPGVASANTGTIRVVGGSAFTRSPRTASGAVVTVAASIIPGVAQVGHVVTYNRADGTSQVVTIYGATDEDLADGEFMLGVLLDEWDPWLIKQREAA